MADRVANSLVAHHRRGCRQLTSETAIPPMRFSETPDFVRGSDGTRGLRELNNSSCYSRAGVPEGKLSSGLGVIPPDADAVQDRARRALAVPLLRYLGAVLIDEPDPAKGIQFTAAPSTLNAAGWLHGGAIATVLDVAAYLAVIEELAADEEALTHGFAASYLAAVPAGTELKATARLLRRGRHIAFVGAELQSNDGLIATANVTKSIRKRA